MRRRILLIGNYLGGSANPGVGEELARYFRSLENTVITVSDKSNRIYRLADMLFTIWQRRNDYEVAQVDVFSGLAFLWAEAACLFLRRMRKPYVLTLHGGNLPDFARRRSVRVKKLLVSANAVTAPSEYLLKEMQTYRRDIRLIPNPLDISRYPHRSRAHPHPVLVWLRAFHNIYNPALAPQVLSYLSQEFPNISLIMVGPDKKDGSLQKTQKVAAELGVQSRITYPGGVPKQQVPEWLDKGDIFINTTNFDNTPVSVLEALACGLCVVSTNVGGINYLLHDEEDALLVPPDNAKAMAASVRRVMHEPDLSFLLSMNARKKTEQFDCTIVMPQWDSLLHGILDG